MISDSFCPECSSNISVKQWRYAPAQFCSDACREHVRARIRKSLGDGAVRRREAMIAQCRVKFGK